MSARADVPGETPFVLPLAQLQLLAEIAFACTGRQIDAPVSAIYEALVLLRPNHAAGAIGLGLEAMLRRDPATAIEVLRRDGITRPRGREEAKAFLLLASKLAHDETAIRELAGELRRAESASAQRFAAYLMSGDEPAAASGQVRAAE